MVSSLPRPSPNQRDPTNGTSTAFVVWAVLGSLDTYFGSFLKDPWMVLGDVFPDVSNPNMIKYEFSTFKMNFTQNEPVKLDETCLDTHKHIEPHMRHIGDLVVERLGRLMMFDFQCTLTLIHCLNTI